MIKSYMSKLTEVLLVLIALLLINIIGQYYYSHIDLTEDKRFTLSDSTTKLVDELEDNMYVQVLLDGELPAGFKRLQNACKDMLSDFNSINSNIDFEFFDPMDGNVESVNRITAQLSEIGVTPTNIQVHDGKERVEKYIYPHAIINHNDRKLVINLLEEQRLGVPNEIILNNSSSLLEYKFADAIYRLTSPQKPDVLFTTGNGELGITQTAAIERTLRDRYNTARVNLDSIYRIEKETDLLIVAKPQYEISKRSQFIMDQYIMNGGKVIWLLDRFAVNVDSIQRNKLYVPRPLELGLDDLFFKYGIKMRDNLVLDLHCSKIPQVTGDQGGKPQLQFYDWFYHPLITAREAHPISKNLDLINLFFPSTIDTVRTDGTLKKTTILSSSEQSRYQMYPMRLNFEILKFDPDPDKFDKGPQALAVLVEGEFKSNFANRVTQDMKNMLSQIDSEFRDKSVPTSQLFVSDGDFIKNFFNPNNQQVSPVGFNIWEEKAFKGNADFLINAVDYMTDDIGLIESRSKELKLHLLNTTKAKEEKTYWQLINVVLPLLLLILFGLVYSYIRKKKFS